MQRGHRFPSESNLRRVNVVRWGCQCPSVGSSRAWENHNLKSALERNPTRTGNLRVTKVQYVELDQVFDAGGNDAWRRWG